MSILYIPKCVKCKGCGKPLFLFQDGSGAVGHWKPNDKLGIPNSVPCDLFNRLNASQLASLHEDAEVLEQPTEFRPVLG
jgi:hypothetical protein